MFGFLSDPLRRAAAVVCVIALAACATTTPDADRRPRSVIVDGIDIAMMAHVLNTGFTEIKERALNEPDMGGLFMRSLEGLSTIDPEVGVGVKDSELQLTYGNVPLSPVALPTHGDIESWVKTTLTAVLTLRQISMPMKTANAEALYKAIFPPALKALDPYSRYAGRDEALRSRLIRDGIIGLGIRVVAAKDGVSVQSIVKNGPAENAGLKLDDLITHVDGVALVNRPIEEVRQFLEGKADTVVQVTIRRPQTRDTFSVAIRRDLVIPDTVAANTVDGVLEIRIRSFNQRTAQSVEKAVLNARDTGPIKGIVLDLRSDPGGLLDQAVDLADLFLDSGTIIALRGRHPGAQQFYGAHGGDIAEGIPITVVIDGRAASASEIVAVALQDNQRAAVVGTVSLGKGSVQTVIRLPNQGEIILTWSRAYTPRGALLHGLGVLPDVCLSGESATLSDTVGRIFRGDGLPTALMNGWRSPPAEAQGLEELRAACPPEAHPERALDLEVARRLVQDPALYVQARQGGARQLAEKPQ
ncbi:MAG: PDZ domain-containing protein [Proteobacteria bacterium]|nr:PDZ domain-containing protein [Pseudomonadota bacterium]